MKKTILHEKHLTLGARMGEFGGWDMPIQYKGILAEHQQTRTESSLFDICHMGEFEISELRQRWIWNDCLPARLHH